MYFAPSTLGLVCSVDPGPKSRFVFVAICVGLRTRSVQFVLRCLLCCKDPLAVYKVVVLLREYRQLFWWPAALGVKAAAH